MYVAVVHVPGVRSRSTPVNPGIYATFTLRGVPHHAVYPQDSLSLLATMDPLLIGPAETTLIQHQVILAQPRR